MGNQIRPGDLWRSKYTGNVWRIDYVFSDGRLGLTHVGAYEGDDTGAGERFRLFTSEESYTWHVEDLRAGGVPIPESSVHVA